MPTNMVILLKLRSVLFLTQSGDRVRFSRLVGNKCPYILYGTFTLSNPLFLSPSPYRSPPPLAIMVTVLLTPQSLSCVYRLNFEVILQHKLLYVYLSVVRLS